MQGKISLFENDKGDNAKRPDFRIVGEIDGQPIKGGLWWTTAKNTGLKYLSGKIEDDPKPRNGAPQQGPQGERAPSQPTAAPRPASQVPPSGNTPERLRDMDVNVDDVDDGLIPF
jgi:hypothetical protein